MSEEPTTIKVLVIGGSAVARRTLTTYINSDDDLEVIGSAADLSIALQKLETLTPDILTLDIHLLDHDSTELIDELNTKHSHPILRVCSNSAVLSSEVQQPPQSPTQDFNFDPADRSGDSVRATIAALCGLLKRHA